MRHFLEESPGQNQYSYRDIFTVPFSETALTSARLRQRLIWPTLFDTLEANQSFMGLKLWIPAQIIKTLSREPIQKVIF